ncbi:MAG: FRG domain-containing protein [Desulfobacteraceae bacterium]|nr:MAG: FRG domain-containing protein [Desulfobacteraceae bacterium]
MSGKEIFWKEEEDVIKCWEDVTKLEEKFFRPPNHEKSNETQKWIFRAERLIEELEKEYFQESGDATSCCIQKENKNDEYLETHLDKAFRLYDVKDEDKGKRERELIRTFQRKAALYLEREPDKDDILEWLAIMRHHGAQTRLSDWVYSFYIAVYFALAENEKGIVWALNCSTINKPEPVVSKICEKENGIRKFSRSLLYYSKKCDFLGIRQEGDKLIDLAITCYLMDDPTLCVYPVNPFRLNKRLSVQQGLFLLPGDITKSFAENLRVTFGGYDETKKYLWRMKIVPETKKKRNEILGRLKDMNISNEALFPGLDGFAKSVGEGLAYPRKMRST